MPLFLATISSAIVDFFTEGSDLILTSIGFAEEILCSIIDSDEVLTLLSSMFCDVELWVDRSSSSTLAPQYLQNLESDFIFCPHSLQKIKSWLIFCNSEWWDWEVELSDGGGGVTGILSSSSSN